MQPIPCLSVKGRLRFPLGLICVCLGACALAAPLRAEEKAAAASAAAEEASSDRARRHHYVFVHRALPSWFFKHADLVWERLEKGGAPEARALWESVGESYDEELRIPSEGMRVEKLDPIAGHDALLVALPAAKRMTEAPYVLLLRKGDALHYLTYELTVASDLSFNGDRAVLCAWNAEGSHLNYGFAGALDQATFVRFATEWLSETAKQDYASAVSAP